MTLRRLFSELPLQRGPAVLQATSRKGRSPEIAPWALCALVLVVLVACSSKPAMIEFPPLICPLTNAPIISVGTVVVPPVPVGDRHSNRFTGRPTQLCRIQANIENVLTGDISPGPATIFVYIYVDSIAGNERLSEMIPGERDVFFLLRDSGELRMTCDSGHGCAPKVKSGPHPGFQWKKGKTVAASVVELMLTRGPGATDQQMLDAIGGDFSCTGEGYGEMYLNQLEVVAREETPPVRAVACNILKEFKRSCGSGPDDKHKKQSD